MSALRLALRVLRVDRRTRTSAILTGIGVAVATGLVLLLAALPQATQERGERSAWQQAYGVLGEESATLLFAASEDVFQGQKITRIDVAALDDPAAVPLPSGVPRLPGPGEVLMSGNLVRLAGTVPGSRLAERFPGVGIGQLGTEALAYPGQLVVLVGHEPSEMPVDALSQHGFAAGLEWQDPLLQLLAGVGVVVLLVPSLVLVASAARLTAARRERRLAALRLAGATPWQVSAMVAAETAIAAVCGSLLGFGVSPVLHSLASRVQWDGGTWQSSDFGLPLGVSVPIVVAMPVLVLLAAVLGLWRVVRAPLGAVSSHEPRRPHWWRLLSLPLAGLFFAFAVVTADRGGIMPVLLGLALIVGSATLVGPWVTAAIGRIFTRVWRGPSVLLAGRRLREDPKGAYRASAGVVLAVFTGSMALTLLPSFESMAGSESPFRDSVLYVQTDSGTAGEIVERTNTALARYGQNERAVVMGEVVLADGPESARSALVADCVTAGTLLRFDMGDACTGAPGVYSRYPVDLAGATVGDDGEMPAVLLDPDTPVRAIPAASDDVYPSMIVDPAVLPAGVTQEAGTVAVPTTSDNHEVVRTALARAADGAQLQSRQARLDGQHTQLSDLRRVTVIGLLAAVALGGGSAAIATAGSVLDRRRTFGALIAAGTPVRVLACALRVEAAMPALVATIGAGTAGVLVAIGLFSLVDDGLIVLSPWILAPVALGAGVALLAASVCRPALNRVQAEPLADQ